MKLVDRDWGGNDVKDHLEGLKFLEKDARLIAFFLKYDTAIIPIANLLVVGLSLWKIFYQFNPFSVVALIFGSFGLGWFIAGQHWQSFTQEVIDLNKQIIALHDKTMKELNQHV
jgi:hypothetical protein